MNYKYYIQTNIFLELKQSLNWKLKVVHQQKTVVNNILLLKKINF